MPQSIPVRKLNVAQFDSLQGEDAKLFFEFLAQQQKPAFWDNNVPIVLEEDTDYNCWPWGEAPQTLELSHRIVVYERKNNKTGLRFAVIDNDPIGKGNFGEVSPILYTIKINEKAEIKISDKPRVVKIETLGTKTLEAINAEVHVSQETEHLGMKSLVTDDTPEAMRLVDGEMRWVSSTTVNAMVMKRLPGKNLNELLKTERLKGQQLLDLTLAILKAYKAQVYDRGIIHGDIKLENIVVDITTQPVTVNFCDYGLSFPINKKDSFTGGTPLYVAPEIVYRHNEITTAADIYSLGRTLGYLWGTDRPEIEVKKGIEYQLGLKFDKFLFIDNGIYDSSKANILTDILNSMCASESKHRASIERVIEQVELLQAPTYQLSHKEKIINNIYMHLNNMARFAVRYQAAGNEYSDIADEIRKTEKTIRRLTHEFNKAHINVATSPEKVDKFKTECLEELDRLRTTVEKKTNKTDPSFMVCLANFTAFLLSGIIPYVFAAVHKYQKTGSPLFFTSPKKSEKPLDKDLDRAIENMERIIKPGIN